ncbi:MAG: bacillithiol system redox-active protein YtxJ [Bacteroidetes bacterium]|nr:MAG: bacillithiol system redox-active protein YtxJ [Bacteroidota bacterium]
MNWIPVTSLEQLDQIAERSRHIPCLIFKHSTRCSISSMAKYRLESDWDIPEDQIECYFLDLIAHRDISNAVAEKFEVWHESPQVILLRDGECVYDASHLDITVDEIKEQLEVLAQN